jgi:hypothetical protein
MNWEQLKGIIERIVTFAIAWAVGKGYVPAGIAGDLTALVVLAAAVIWGWKVNTPAALDSAAKAVK